MLSWDVKSKDAAMLQRRFPIASAIVAFAAVLVVQTRPVLAQSLRKGPTSDPSLFETLLTPLTDWLERANRDYQDTVVKELSTLTPKGAAQAKATQSAGLPSSTRSPSVQPDERAESKARDDAILARQREARSAEQARAERARQASEAKKVADLADAATRDRQRIAEKARHAQDDRGRAAPDLATNPPVKSDGKGELKSAAMPSDANALKTGGANDAKPKSSPPNATVTDDGRKQVSADKVREDALQLAASARAEAAAKLAVAKLAAKQADAAQAADTTAANQRAADRAKPQVAQSKLPEPPVTPPTIATNPKGADTVNPRPSDTVKSVSTPTRSDTADQKLVSRSADVERRGFDGLLEKVSKDKRTRLASAGEASNARSTVAKPTGLKHVSKGNTCSKAGLGIDPPAIYVVKKGDTLWAISRRHYEKGAKFEKIVRANSAKITQPDRIYPCQKFYLPSRHAFYWGEVVDDLEAS